MDGRALRGQAAVEAEIILEPEGGVALTLPFMRPETRIDSLGLLPRSRYLPGSKDY